MRTLRSKGARASRSRRRVELAVEVEVDLDAPYQHETTNMKMLNKIHMQTLMTIMKKKPSITRNIII